MLEQLERGGADLPHAIDCWEAPLADRESNVRFAEERFLFSGSHGLARPATVQQPAGLRRVLMFSDEIPGKTDCLQIQDSENIGRERRPGRIR